MNSLRKTSIVYTGFALLSLVIAFVYPIFGHGVSSEYFFVVCPVLSIPGALLFACLSPWIANTKRYRLFLNTYNFGVAAVVCGLLAKGVVDIAGGASDIIVWFFYVGALIAVFGAGVLVSILLTGDKRSKCE